MKRTRSNKSSTSIFGLSLAIVLLGLAPATETYASSSNEIIVVPPTALPTLARQGGEAMFLHDSADGRTLLYVEQREGTQLAIFDVTDPAHVKGEGSVQLNAPAPFDFVADLGTRGELVRFRGGQGDAVLDLRKIPSLRRVPGLDTRNSVILVADGDSRFTGQPINIPLAQGARDYKIFQSKEPLGVDTIDDERIVEIRQVRQEATNADTGTTFLLAQSGVYLIRRPALEETPSEVLPGKSN
jgi:hypothetical protein